MPSITSRSPDLLAVVLLADAEIARGRTLVDAVQQARSEPAPARVVGLDVQGTRAELEEPLQTRDGVRRLGAGEGAVELDATTARAASELDARKVLAVADLKVGEGLVVLEFDVERGWTSLTRRASISRASTSDSAGTKSTSAMSLTRSAVRGRRRQLGEVVGGAVAQVLGLADVEDAALIVLHQVDAGRGRKLLDFLAWRQGA